MHCARSIGIYSELRQHWDEIRNNDPLQPVIKQLGFVCSALPRAGLLWSSVSADLGGSHTDMLTTEAFPALCIWCDGVENVARSWTQHWRRPALNHCRYITAPFNVPNWPPFQCETTDWVPDKSSDQLGSHSSTWTQRWHIIFRNPSLQCSIVTHTYISGLLLCSVLLPL